MSSPLARVSTTRTGGRALRTSGRWLADTRVAGGHRPDASL